MLKTSAMHLYEYAVIRYVPDVEREEFFNIGLVMMCKRRRWIKAKININAEKLKAFGQPTEKTGGIDEQAALFEKICDGASTASPIASLEAEERFRWLTAVKSCCLQTSRPHPGKTDDLDATFNKLYATLVE